VVAVAITYSLGLAAVMLLYGLGGRAVIARIRRFARGQLVERALGVVLILTGVAMSANLDVRFEEALARDASLPAFLVDPTRALENSSAVQKRLASLRPPSRFAVRQQEASNVPMPTSNAASIPGVKTPPLPDLGTAPPFIATQRWFNTPGGRPLSIAGLRGRVVLIDFWTYTCINCIRTLPFLKGLYATYRPYGLEIVGVETPEFTFEQEASNVLQAIHSDGLRYPVVQDNRYGTWDIYQNQYWPAEYLIDPRGHVRHTQFGEGDYKQTEAAVRALLFDAGVHNLPPPMTATAIRPSAGLATPETYLDDQRSSGFAQPLAPGVHFFGGVATPALNEFALRGDWRVTSEFATPTAPGAAIQAGFQAARVYLVMTSTGNVPRTVRVLLDGHAFGDVTVQAQQLYSLVSLPQAEFHSLTVQVPPGVRAYDFTFG
jgi:thiol-disulfide isomerase/thioredoxin